MQRPAVNRIIALTAQPPGPEGPPAELRSAVRRTQLTGVALLVLTLAVLALMVWKPALGRLGSQARGRPSSSRIADRRE